MGDTIGRWRSRSLWLFAAAALTVSPGLAVGQQAEGSSAGGFEVTGYVGVLTPLARLADQGDTISAEFSTKAAFALELDFWLDNGLGFAVVGAYSRPDLTIQVFEEDSPFPLPIELGTADMWFVTADIMFRPNLGGAAAVLKPYFGAGAGVLSLTYPQREEIQIGDEERFVGNVFAGAHYLVTGPLFARLDIRDYISKLDTPPFEETRLQHDLIVSFGLGVHIP